MAVPQISLPIIVGGALVDSINPCVIGVLLLLITVLLKTKKRSSILTYGSIYIAGVYLTYLMGGLTLLSIFNSVRSIQFISQVLYVVIGAFVMGAGFLEVKDFFWYGRGFSLSIPHRFISFMENKVKTVHTSYLSALVFGSLVTLIELPCTGAPYLAVLALMTQIDFYIAFLYLLLYNLIFVLPLVAIIYIAYTGVGVKSMEGWRHEHRGKLRFFIGLFLLILGVWIITTIVEWLFMPLIYLIIGVIVAMYIFKKLEAKFL